MRLPNHRFRAQRKRVNRPAIWRIYGPLLLSLAFLSGCSGGMSSFPRVASFFGQASATPTPAVNETPAPAATAAFMPSPTISETVGHPVRKTAKQAPPAPKPAPSVATQTVAPRRTKADVSLEANPGASADDVPRPSASGLETPSSAPSTAASRASVASVTTPTLDASTLESSRSPSEGNPEKAAKLIQDVDKIEKRVDRRNLSSDDSQRDILAQKLMQEARRAFAEHDSVAAISLATKASTLLEPLPKLADSDIPSSP
jgi:hypothetical protein